MVVAPLTATVAAARARARRMAVRRAEEWTDVVTGGVLLEWRPGNAYEDWARRVGGRLAGGCGSGVDVGPQWTADIASPDRRVATVLPPDATRYVLGRTYRHSCTCQSWAFNRHAEGRGGRHVPDPHVASGDLRRARTRGTVRPLRGGREDRRPAGGRWPAHVLRAPRQPLRRAHPDRGARGGRRDRVRMAGRPRRVRPELTVHSKRSRPRAGSRRAAGTPVPVAPGPRPGGRACR